MALRLVIDQPPPSSAAAARNDIRTGLHELQSKSSSTGDISSADGVALIARLLLAA